MQNIFTYGTLMTDPVWQHVVNRAFDSVPAKAQDFARYAVRDEAYPGVVAQRGAHVDGRLYLGVDAASCAKLDAFEGEHYRRDCILVSLANGQTLPAWIYVYLLPTQLTLDAWDVQRFEQEGGLQKFLSTYTPTVR